MINQSLYALLVDDTIQLVKVRFHQRERGDVPTKEYIYKTDVLDLSIGDFVLCETYQHYAVAQVTGLAPEVPLDSDNITYRWVVARVDVSAHEARLSREAAMIAHINKQRLARAKQAARDALAIDIAEFQLMTSASTPSTDN